MPTSNTHMDSIRVDQVSGHSFPDIPPLPTIPTLLIENWVTLKLTFNTCPDAIISVFKYRLFLLTVSTSSPSIQIRFFAAKTCPYFSFCKTMGAHSIGVMNTVPALMAIPGHVVSRDSSEGSSFQRVVVPFRSYDSELLPDIHTSCVLSCFLVHV
jgi:hypothetical protein